MNEVTFKKIIIQNFMSVGDTPLEIDFETGLTFLTGWNADTEDYNGVGKTTIINAFFFALFGTLYGDNSGKLKKSDIVNNVTNETALVTLYLETDGDEYEIVRSVAPSACKIIKNGDASKQKASIAESNAEICKIINGDVEVYSNTVVMDSDTASFLLKKPEQKRKFVDSVLGLSIFTDMLKLVKDDFTAKGKEYREEETKLQEKLKFLERDKANETQWDNTRIERVKTLRNQIDNLKDSIATLENLSPPDQKDEIAALQETIKTSQEKINKAHTAKARLQSDLTVIKADASRLKEDLIDPDSLICKTCKRPLDDHDPLEIEKENDAVNAKIDAKRKEYKEKAAGLKKVEDYIANLTKLIATSSAKIEECNKKQLEADGVGGQIQECRQQIAMNNKSIDSIKAEVNPFTESLGKLKAEIDEKKQKVADLKEEVEVLDYVKYLCSPEGVKSHIIAKIVTLFNAKLNSYNKVLGSPFKVTFDEFFDYTIQNGNGADVSYHSLSGGERKRINLGILFAFRDIRRMQSNLNINVTMFDELLDSAMCSVGREKALGILKEHADEHKESVLIITHRMDEVDDSLGSTLYLEKKGGITTMVDSLTNGQ